MGSSAGHHVWRDEKVRTACTAPGKPSGLAGCGRGERKEPGVDHRALPSRDRVVRKAHGVCGRARYEGAVAGTGKIVNSLALPRTRPLHHGDTDARRKTKINGFYPNRGCLVVSKIRAGKFRIRVSVINIR